MDGGLRYRISSVLGVISLSILAISVPNIATVQRYFSYVPIIGKLPFEPAAGGEFVIEATVVTTTLMFVLLPMFKPRPRRILDIGYEAFRRVLIGLFAIATIGYFDFTYRVPRAALLVAGTFLLLTIPTWFVFTRRQPSENGGRVVIIGDDSEQIKHILRTIDGNVLGHISPLSAYFGQSGPQLSAPELTDGGLPSNINDLMCLGGLSRLDEILIEYDVGTAVLAFTHPDRMEFFGALDSCYEHGVAAKVHRDHADVVLTGDITDDELVDVDLEPWDWQDHVLKRLFDVGFATTALLVISPLLVVIAVAIKLDSPGPILYRQTRTATFGDTFTIAKFRSMVTDAEADSGAKLSKEDAGGVDPRVTRVGHILRRTHLDEIPQLLAILRGEMSVVGPRPERPEFDTEIQEGTDTWRRRWFVKPGLTGLAQINDVTGFDPEQKLRYDIVYIRQQSFWSDLKIVIRQLWKVGEDVLEMAREKI